MVDQSPVADTQVSFGSTVTVTVSDGPEEVPFVVGDTREEAIKKLEAAGFKVYVDETDEESDAKPGEVVDQSTARGETADQDTEIRITVSTYVAPTEEPTESETPPTETPPTETLPTDPLTP